MDGGFFISLEGPEGSGKTTQARALEKALQEQGYPVRLVREPGATALGEEIRQVLLRKGREMVYLAELLLYQAARAQNTRENIIPFLQEGGIVISDRYADSSVAYQGYGRGLPRCEIERINNMVCYGVQPDLTILLDLDPRLGLARGNREEFDRLEQENLEFHRRVREGYLILSRERDNYLLLPATEEPEILQEKILEAVLPLLAGRVERERGSSNETGNCGG